MALPMQVDNPNPSSDLNLGQDGPMNPSRGFSSLLRFHKRNPNFETKAAHVQYPMSITQDGPCQCMQCQLHITTWTCIHTASCGQKPCPIATHSQPIPSPSMTSVLLGGRAACGDGMDALLPTGPGLLGRSVARQRRDRVWA